MSSFSVCNHKPAIKLCQDTVIERWPLYCPKYKKEILINVEQLKMVIIKSQTQSSISLIPNNLICTVF